MAKKSTQGKAEEFDVSSGSDFDDEDDPDCVEVPGGGRDLSTISKIAEPTLGMGSQTGLFDDLLMPTPAIVPSQQPSAERQYFAFGVNAQPFQKQHLKENPESAEY